MTVLRIPLTIVVFAALLGFALQCAKAQKPDEPAFLQEVEEAFRLAREADELFADSDSAVKRKAIRKYAASAMIFRRLGSNSDEAAILDKLAAVYNSLGEKGKATESVKTAVMLRDPRFKAEEAFANTNIPTIRTRYGQLAGNSGAVTLNNLSNSIEEPVSNESLVEYFTKELAGFRRSGDRRAEAMLLTRIGSVYGSLGKQTQALASFQQALSLRRKLKDQVGEAVTLNSVGRYYDGLGDKARAIRYFDQALKLCRSTGSKAVEAATLNNLGATYGSLGDRQKALDYFTHSLAMKRDLSDARGEVATLNNVGALFSSLGDRLKALEYYRTALSRSDAIIDREAKGTILHNIGESYQALGDVDQALQYYKDALVRRQNSNDIKGQGITLNAIGRVYEDRGSSEKALEYYEKSLVMRKRSGDKSGEATTLNNLGALYISSGNTTKALEYLYRSLLQRRTVGDKSGEAATLHNIMFARRSDGSADLAVLAGKQSVNIYQSLRANLVRLDRETRAAYTLTVERTYRDLADSLIARGRIAEAEQVLGLLKDDEYFSYLQRNASVTGDLKSRISLTAEEKKAFDDYDKIAGVITAAAEALNSLEKKKNSLSLEESLNETDQKEYDRLKTHYDAAVTVFNKYLDDLKVKFSEQDARVAAIESDTVGLLKKLNEPRTVIISTIAGENRLNLIVTTSHIQKAHTVEIKAIEVSKMVADFRKAVTDPRLDPKPSGKKLYDLLFPPALKKDLDNIQTDTIVWSLDGTLRYVPTAALWDGEKYLAERYRTAVITLASRDKLDSNVGDSKPWRAFGVGVSKAVYDFSALPSVPKELCSVVDDPKKRAYCKDLGLENGVIDGQILADEEFTLAGFKRSLGRTSVVHVASHFSINPGNGTNSFLLLGGGSERQFSLDDLRKTRLDNTELLTLSACNTAMTSGTNATGVEVEGFGALAQKQGAKSVLATLWAVADESTQKLMTEFYRLKIGRTDMSKAEALSSVQRAMIAGRIKPSGIGSGCRAELNASGAGFKCDANAPFSHPFFWSPFVLIGNWR